MIIYAYTFVCRLFGVSDFVARIILFAYFVFCNFSILKIIVFAIMFFLNFCDK